MHYPVADLVALGGEHTTLGEHAKRAAETVGFTMSPDPQPEEVRFIRSDQFSFVTKGIPAITYKGGFVSGDPSMDGEKLTRDWLRTIYHSAADDTKQKLDYDAGARWAQVNLDLAVAVANANDFFGAKFGR
jgi:Zn-dependent M28 family amino/carboxypeptidase